MTFYSRLWRYKKLKKIRVINKIHNIVLSLITGIMFVFFLLPFCLNTINRIVLAMFCVAIMWLFILHKANKMEEFDD